MQVRLDDQLCFALYAATNSIVRAYRPLLERIGLTYPQYLVMMVLWESDGRAVREVAARLDLPPHGLTPVLDRLVAAGFVHRGRDRHDGRVVRLHLTPAGARLEHEAALVQADVVCRTGLAEPALAALREQLHELVGAVRAAGDATEDSATDDTATDDTATRDAATRAGADHDDTAAALAG